MTVSDDQQQNDGEELSQAPAVVLPSPNSQGVGGQPSGLASGALIAPQPFLGDGGGVDDTPSLASRIEQILAEDGRFNAFSSALVITTADEGTVHLAGAVPSDGRRRSLLAAIRALPGVALVQDDLTVE